MQLTQHIRSRFPDDLELIRQECGRSESFQTLCEDLSVCARALARWRKNECQGSLALTEEYARSLEELEQELEEWLDRLKASN